MVKLSYSLIIVPVLLLSGISIFYTKEIIYLIYHDVTDASLTTFSILMPGLIFISTSYIFGTLLTANGNLKALNIMAIIGLVLNVVLNLVLIPRIQVTGSAVAAIITQAFTAISQVIISLVLFKFHFKIKAVTGFVFFTLIIGFAGYYSTDITSSWVINMSLFLIGGISLAFILKIIKPKDIYQILKYDV
jgi:O-antigen/teichoic acid export membrane protein